MQIHAEIGVPNADGHRDLVLVAVGPAHEVAPAAKAVERLTPLFSKSDPPGALTTRATWSAVVQLQATFGQTPGVWRPGPALCAWITEQVNARTTLAASTQLYYAPPAGLTPYPWQVEGAAMIAATGRALITDEPGTGKTITTILGLAERVERGSELGPILVVCPASVIDAWVDAWRAWAPHVRVVAWRGTPKKRAALISTADVYVTSYDLARTDCPPTTLKKPAPLRDLGRDGWGAVVVDECHLIKSLKAERSKAVRRLTLSATEAGGAVVCLSGTPITHHPGDLWPTLNALDHHATPARERWVARYCDTVPAGDYDVDVLGLAAHAEAEFRLTLLGQHRRVAKADVLTQLPPKVYSTRTVDMPAAWRKAYDEFESEMYAELPSTDGPDGATTELSVMDVMSKYGHLTRLASAAADVDITYGPDLDAHDEPKRHVHLTLKDPSWKVDALLELLEERRRDDAADGAGEQVVVFAPSAQLVRLAGAAAARAGFRVGYIVGGQGHAERSQNMRDFQAGDLDVICVTTSAGGVGITLTAARTVVFLQRPWSIVESIQAEDRCHRIGSERHDSIEVIDIVARNTIDTRVRAVLRERAGQLADLVQDPRIVAELLGGSRSTEHRAERKEFAPDPGGSGPTSTYKESAA
ncbi:DEAD/DEAH box helicase [Nocardioides marinquilinus]|uniref:DEAD/DEAH box helicase n=1 Tax=Nocardioides marinquilinus TaxID=1210400 RepID=UPI0031EB5126